MKEKQKNLLLLGFALEELRQKYKIGRTEAVPNIEHSKLKAMFEKEFPKSPTKEDLIHLAMGSYKKLNLK